MFTKFPCLLTIKQIFKNVSTRQRHNCTHQFSPILFTQNQRFTYQRTSSLCGSPRSLSGTATSRTRQALAAAPYTVITPFSHKSILSKTLAVNLGSFCWVQQRLTTESVVNISITADAISFFYAFFKTTVVILISKIHVIKLYLLLHQKIHKDKVGVVALLVVMANFPRQNRLKEVEVASLEVV